METIIQDLEKVLKKDDRLFSEEGEILKNKVSELAFAYDEKLLALLHSNTKLRKQFFVELKDKNKLIFKVDDFVAFVNRKEFLPDSFTKFKNRIGLQSNGEYLRDKGDVVLAFPYKDCVLEGGQDKDDQKRDEVFYNEVLAPDEIDRLFEPKVLTNFKKFDKSGEKTVTEVTENDNLIIKGNNLLALHSLKDKYRGKVKLIYIDPPYNTGGDSFGYNDKFNHSSWLTFLKSRLEVAKDFLSEDGTIWINIDDDESHYLKVLCDEVFGRTNFVSNIIWQKKYSPQNDATWFSDMHDHILVYAQNKSVWRPYLLPRTKEMNSRYSNPDNDPRGDWKSSDLSVKTYSKSYDYPVKTPSGRVVNPPKNRCWRMSKDRLEELIKDNRIWFGEDGNNVPSVKKFLSEVKDGKTPQTIWLYNDVGHNQEAKKELDELLDDEKFGTPKPERLIQKILQISTKEGDLVMDFFVGSGTTTAVSHKMRRCYIGIEQMDYARSIVINRIKSVMSGEQGGISKDVNWEGGGSFVYTELQEWNSKYIAKLEDAKTGKDIAKIYEALRKEPFFRYDVDLSQFDEKEFFKLSVEDQKNVLLECLDKNHLYVNYCDIDDATYKVSDEDKKSNKLFYGRK